MLDSRNVRLVALAVLFMLVAIPPLARAAPPVSLGTLDVRGTRTIPLPVVVIRNPPALPDPVAADLPPEARSAYRELQRASTERTQIVSAMRARGMDATPGPTLRDVIEREKASSVRLLRALERGAASLKADGWLLLAELRLARALERTTAEQPEPTAQSLAPAREAYAQAAALGGTTPTGLWARLRESAAASSVGDVGAARSGLAVVIANAPPGALRATALVEQAALVDGAQATRLFARALDEGADAALRAYIRFASMLANRYADPVAARDAGVSILSEGDAATAATAAPIVGELLVRTGDPSGLALSAAVPPDLAARTLLAAGDAALAIGERGWAALAWQSASERAPNSASARTAATKRAELAAQPAPGAETVAQWLVRQATRCHGDALAANDRATTGEFDVLVRRQRGTVRVVARVRPGAGPGAARFERCIEGPLPNPSGLDASTIYQGALRLR